MHADLVLRDVLVNLLGPQPESGYPCPSWPADVFAVVAQFLVSTGEYTRVVESNQSGLTREWPEEAQRIGEQWRASIDMTNWEAWLETPPATAPSEVVALWAQFCAWVSPHAHRDASVPLKLLGIADEASAGIGFRDTAETTFQRVWLLASATSRDRSMCLSIRLHAARVLPKQHTAQRGLTLRSLTHHLALIPHLEVEALWQAPRQEDDTTRSERLNILCLPWPLAVDRKSFRVLRTLVDGVATMDPDQHRFFELDRSSNLDLGQRFSRYLTEAFTRVLEWCDRVDVVLLPELALDLRLFERFREHCVANQCIGISGLALEEGQTLASHVGPANLAAVVFENQGEPILLQSKHHRWCLDAGQIRQYGLAGLLPSSIDLWERIRLSARQSRFVTISTWLTFTTLICEDLARQDPMAATLRAVGPNLVFALLMDGPQLRHRWGPRYAASLAEDPGSSVCILTSLGLTRLSAPREQGSVNRSRVVGLWKDVQRDVELELREDETALVLHVDRESRAEFSADGRRSDAGFFPVLRDYHGLRAGGLD